MIAQKIPFNNFSLFETELEKLSMQRYNFQISYEILNEYATYVNDLQFKSGGSFFKPLREFDDKG